MRRREKVKRGFNQTGELPKGWKLCAVCIGAFQSSRQDAKYCGRKFRVKAHRRRKTHKASPGETDKPVLEPVAC